MAAVAGAEALEWRGDFEVGRLAEEVLDVPVGVGIRRRAGLGVGHEGGGRGLVGVEDVGEGSRGEGGYGAGI